MVTFDPRITPARPEIAADFLRDTVTSARYVTGRALRIGQEVMPMKATLDAASPTQTTGLFGEDVTVYEERENGWAWGQLARDGYVGWFLQDALAAPLTPITHKVNVLRTLVFPEASIKAPPLTALPLGARVSVTKLEGKFAMLSTGGFAIATHLIPVTEHTHHDPVAVAEWFLAAPYLWGGCSALGLDCSGLVQAALKACGYDCPRDSDQQEAAVGEAVMGWRPETLQRGDLVFWKGHVAMARGDGTLIHANAHHMFVALEDAAACIARIAATGSDVTSVKRFIKKQ